MSDKALKGSCHCQKTGFVAQGPKNFEFFCYCADCKKLVGGGRLCGIAVNEHAVESHGQFSSYGYPGGSGQNIELFFCSKCSTQMYSKVSAHPGTVILRANVLDEGVFEPKSDLFKEKAFVWDPGLK